MAVAAGLAFRHLLREEKAAAVAHGVREAELRFVAMLRERPDRYRCEQEWTRHERDGALPHRR